ncbi:MAG: hypothetical protein ACE5IB_07895 [Candidatus Geothermarchaeales archaeon]
MKQDRLDRAEGILWEMAEALVEIARDAENKANVRRQAARDVGAVLGAWLRLREQTGTGDEDYSALLEKLPKKYRREFEEAVKNG